MARPIGFLALLVTASALFAQHRGASFTAGARLSVGSGFGRPGFISRYPGAPDVLGGLNWGPYGNFAFTDRFFRGFATPLLFRSRAFFARFNNRFGYGAYPYGAGYGYFPALIADYEYPLPPSPYPPPCAAPSDAETPAQITPAVEPAHPIVHEYDFKEEVTNAGSAPQTFTIALKDGSTRSASFIWIQDRQLHYLAPDGTQAALAADQLDRDATRRLNGNIRLQLPPV